MHFVLFLIFTTLGLWTQRRYAQDVRVFLRPLEFIAGEGLAATFNCSVSNADGLLWRVDNIILPDNRLTVRGITGPTTTNESRNFQSQITIPATPENDNSSVRCDGTEPESVNGNNVGSDISFQAQDNPVVTFSFSTVGLGIQLSVVLICPCATFSIVCMQPVMLLFALRAHQLEVPTALMYTQWRLLQSLPWRQWCMDHWYLLSLTPTQ